MTPDIASDVIDRIVCLSYSKIKPISEILRHFYDIFVGFSTKKHQAHLKDVVNTDNSGEQGQRRVFSFGSIMGKFKRSLGRRGEKNHLVIFFVIW